MPPNDPDEHPVAFAHRVVVGADAVDVRAGAALHLGRLDHHLFHVREGPLALEVVPGVLGPGLLEEGLVVVDGAGVGVVGHGVRLATPDLAAHQDVVLLEVDLVPLEEVRDLQNDARVVEGAPGEVVPVDHVRGGAGDVPGGVLLHAPVGRVEVHPDADLLLLLQLLEERDEGLRRLQVPGVEVDR